MEKRGPCIGIDLGTAYTRVASFDGNQMKMIPDQYGESAMPSYVAFTDSGVLIGRAARTQAPQYPTNTIFVSLTAKNLLIPKHTPIPAKKELILSNWSDNLSSFSIIVQECELASMEVPDYEFRVFGIAPKMRGNSRINLSFEVDSSGILNLKAQVVTARGENEIVIVVGKENGGLTMEEIVKMVKGAARYKAEDGEQKARVAALCSLDNLAYKVKEMTRNLRAPASYKKSREEIIDTALIWLDVIDHNAGIDHINVWKMRLEAVKISLKDHVRINALSSLENLANKIKSIAKDPGVAAASKKSMEKVAHDAIAFLETNYDATIDEINAWKVNLQIVINKIVYLGASATS